MVVLGGFSFSCTPDNTGFQAVSGFMKEFNVLCCDDLSSGMATYFNSSLNHSSCIDHVFANAALHTSIKSITVDNCYRQCYQPK